MARSDHTRGLRDEANVGPDPRTARELRRLSELRFKVADGEPDIRGWSVYASTGRELGVVEDLLVDVEAGEVVMLDVDLRRDDRHAYAPVRAAWVDHGTRRVVLDVRSVEGIADRDDLLPTLPRRDTLTDDEVDRFDAGYARAYGDRGLERDHAWRLRHGEDELRFGRDRDRDRDRDRGAGGLAGGLAAGAAGAAGAAALGGARDAQRSDRADRVAERTTTDPGEPWDGGRTVRPEDRAPRRLLDPHDADATRRMDASGPLDLPSPRPPQAHGAHFDESRRVNAELAGLDAERRAAARDGTADDARTLDDDRAITPLELDAQVRMAEGGHVDDRTPVQGVRYDGATHQPHDYGRPDERYGAEYGSGRIGFDRVVTRRRWNDDDASRTAPHGDLAPRDHLARDPRVDDRRPEAFPSGDVGAGLGAGGMAAGTAPRMADATGTTRPADPTRADAPARDALAHDPARLPADQVGRDPRDRDADGHVSLGERLRDTLGDVRDRLRGDTADDAEARRIRYRRYDDGYDPGTPHR